MTYEFKSTKIADFPADIVEVGLGSGDGCCIFELMAMPTEKVSHNCIF